MIAVSLASCSDDDDQNPVVVQPDLRTKIDYAKITPTTPYKALFTDAKGDTTVDLTVGNNRYRMFQALNYYWVTNQRYKDSRCYGDEKHVCEHFQRVC